MKILNPNQERVAQIVANSDVRTTAAPNKKAARFDREAKLLSHLDKIVEWKNTGTTYPINVVIDPTYKCNHRCPGCHGLMGQDTATISLEKLDQIIRELAQLGVRACNLGGGGDPSCHPDFSGVLKSFKKHGLPVGYYTNGELLRDTDIQATIEACPWVRFSLDADGPEIHQLVHRASPKAFDKVVRNMSRMHQARVKHNSDIVLGAGYLVRPDTIKGVYGAAKLCRDIGLDYLRVRPFFGYDNQPLCNNTEADEIVGELERCKELESESFKIDSPQNRMDWVVTGQPEITYTRCNVHHFSTHIGGDLKVYLCCHTVGWEKYCLGDLSKQTFSEIWNSKRRRDIYESIDYRDCATPCSMSVFNKLLHKFENEPVHKDFL